MNLTQDQLEIAMNSTKELRELIDQLLQVLGQEYTQVETLNDTLDELLCLLEEDLISCTASE